MKKLILCLTFVAFAVGAQVAVAQCGQDKAAKAACAEKAKACPLAKSECKKDAACKKEGAACCKAAATSEKKVVQSPKAAGEAAK